MRSSLNVVLRERFWSQYYMQRSVGTWSKVSTIALARVELKVFKVGRNGSKTLSARRQRVNAIG